MKVRWQNLAFIIILFVIFSVSTIGVLSVFRRKDEILSVKKWKESADSVHISLFDRKYKGNSIRILRFFPTTDSHLDEVSFTLGMFDHEGWEIIHIAPTDEYCLIFLKEKVKNEKKE